MTDPTPADLHRLADMLTDYAHNVQDVAYQVRAGRLGDLAHTLSQGRAIPVEQWARLLGGELQDGLTPILLLCGKLWGEEALLKHERETTDRRAQEHRVAWARAAQEREEQRRLDQMRSVVRPLSEEPPELEAIVPTAALPSPLQYPDRDSPRLR